MLATVPTPMLRELKIRNLAILPEVRVDFEKGLNVLTGETGAGKSILIGALGLLAGDRASADDVRSGEETALVEAVLELPFSSPAWAIIREAGIQPSPPELILRRTIHSDGRSRAYVNDAAWTVSGLGRIAPYWIDISGQRGTQQLLSEDFHRDLLDAYGGLGALLGRYRAAYLKAFKLHRELEEILLQRAEAARNRDFLEFQFRELKEARLRAGELEELEIAHRRAAHGAQLSETVENLEQLLAGEGGADEKMRQAGGHLKSAARLDPSLENWTKTLEELSARFSELTEEVGRYKRSLTVEQGEIDTINARMALLQNLARKYGSLEKAIETRDRIATSLLSHEDFELRERQLRASLEGSYAELVDAGAELTAEREKAGRGFTEEVARELRTLGMPSADLKIEFGPPPAEGSLEAGQKFFGPFGAENVRILFAPNPGEGFKPLAKIASGGELSRILLGVKSVALARADADGMTYLFDEVDSGIGGETAERVGIRLRALSKGRQALCVTHLAQVACYATTHLRVEKEVRKGRTMASVERLGDKERKDELARMIGGIKVTEKTKDYASELLGRGNHRFDARRPVR
ncbi:MAG: DNA repair protein RecN [Pseudomonadota bacterium]